MTAPAQRPLGLNPADPIYAAAFAAFLGLVPFCIPLQLLVFVRAGTCGDLWLRAFPIYGAAFLGVVAGRRGAAPPQTAHTASHAEPLWRLARFFVIASSLANLAIIVAAVAVLGLAQVLAYREFYSDLPAMSVFTQYHVTFLLPFIFLSRRLGRSWKPITLFALGALFLRAVLLSERLALAEGGLAVVVALGLDGALRVRLRHLLAGGTIGLMLWFGTEMTRNFYKQVGVAVLNPALARLGVQWLAERLVGYYADTANKFLLAVQHFEPLLYPQAFLPVPVKALQMANQMHTYDFAAGRVLRLAHGGGYSPLDLTNPGGITVLVLDWGWAGTIVAGALIGLIAGVAYRRAAAGRPLALMLYSGLLASVFELPRVFYLGLDRFVVPLTLSLMMFGGILVLRRERAVARAASPRTP